jgi:hypothetical protein
MHSALVGSDENGNRIGPLLRAGIPQTAKLSPMPQFSDLSDRQIAAIVTWIHYARRQGRYQELTAASFPPGDAAAGNTYFNRACSSCHAIDRDLAGIGSKYDAAALRAAVLDPKGLKVELSFTVDRLKDTKLTAAQQRHHALLETIRSMTWLISSCILRPPDRRETRPHSLFPDQVGCVLFVFLAIVFEQACHPATAGFRESENPIAPPAAPKSLSE